MPWTPLGLSRKLRCAVVWLLKRPSLKTVLGHFQTQPNSKALQQWRQRVVKDALLAELERWEEKRVRRKERHPGLQPRPDSMLYQLARLHRKQLEDVGDIDSALAVLREDLSGPDGRSSVISLLERRVRHGGALVLRALDVVARQLCQWTLTQGHEVLELARRHGACCALQTCAKPASRGSS